MVLCQAPAFKMFGSISIFSSDGTSEFIEIQANERDLDDHIVVPNGPLTFRSMLMTAQSDSSKH